METNLVEISVIMSGSPPPSLSQLPTSPTGYFRPIRSRKPPDKYGVWVSDKRDMSAIPDLVLSSDEESSDDNSDETLVQFFTPQRISSSVTAPSSGPPPPRVTGPPFSPTPFNSPSSSPSSEIRIPRVSFAF